MTTPSCSTGSTNIYGRNEEIQKITIWQITKVTQARLIDGY